MNCPVDNTQLQMTERQGIEIDYCPTCRGVWLDRGELDKIIDRAAPAPAPTAAPAGRFDRDEDDDRDRDRRYDPARGDYDRDRSSDRPYPATGHGTSQPRSKRRGLLGDLFDFD